MVALFLLSRADLRDVFDLLSRDGTLGGWEGRLDIWRNSVQALGDFSFTGIGIGTFTTILPLLYPLQFSVESYPTPTTIFCRLDLTSACRASLPMWPVSSTFRDGGRALPASPCTAADGSRLVDWQHRIPGCHVYPRDLGCRALGNETGVSALDLVCTDNDIVSRNEHENYGSIEDNPWLTGAELHVSYSMPAAYLFSEAHRLRL
ncbi:MAG: hypothetical protein R2838_25755 [Caldilineaceae bacterium]